LSALVISPVLFRRIGLSAALLACVPALAQAAPSLCDASSESCRTTVLNLIASEKVGIDVSFWFMDDARYPNALVKAWNAGVPVRVIMDPRASVNKPANGTTLNQLQAAGIPMRMKSSGDIAHWKGMIFAGQHVAEFSGANFSPYEYVPQTPYIDYNDEVVYFSDEPDVVDSLMTHFDDVWTDYSGYADYANVVDPTHRNYPTYPIAPEFNFPPDDSYFNRLHPLMQKEATAGAAAKIDVTMYRITDSREADDMIAAAKKGVPVRLYAEPNEYRNPTRLDDSYNIDRMYMGGVQIRMRAHTGLNHQKTVQLYSQGLTVFGTSNWSTASDDNQLEVNYFTTKTWFFESFTDLFERKWNNSHVMPDGTNAIETKPFVPLGPDKPANSSPTNNATGQTAKPTLKWAAGYWARQYDIYVGITPTLHVLKSNVNLGPSKSSSDLKSYALPTLQPGTTYYWQIVSRTMANLTATGAVWSFTTSGTAPAGICTDPAATNYTAAGSCTYAATAPGTPTAPSPASGSTTKDTAPTLSWSSSGATTFDVSFGTSTPPPVVKTGQTAASYVPGTLAASTRYYWKIVAHNAVGTTTGPVWSFTTPASTPPGTLPSPWTDADIGAVGAAGSAGYASGTFTVSGAGADIWNSADAFHYVYQPLKDDGALVARVATVQNVASWTKAGVMIRNTLAANSAYALMLVSAAKGTAFQYRTSAGAAAAGVDTGASAAPMWVKVSRAGTTLSGYQSSNGTDWTLVGSATISMNSSVFVGLAVSSHTTSSTATATFDNVALGGGAPPPPPSPPSAPALPSPDDAATAVTPSPTLTWTASGATSYDVAFGTSNPPPTAATRQAAANYRPSSLAEGTTYFWQVVASNDGGNTRPFPPSPTYDLVRVEAHHDREDDWIDWRGPHRESAGASGRPARLRRGRQQLTRT
jgi:phosphatidylserine/phosphatidylglycerophosphate/cardiolipin synthase-like enzyme